MSFQKGKGYKKSIGFHTSKNGARKQKMFWLGKNEQKAEILCLMIISRWKELKNAAAEVWDEESLDYLKEYKNRLYEKGKYKPTVKSSTSKRQDKHVPPVPIPKQLHSSSEPISDLSKPVTLYGAIDKYISNVKSDMNFSEEWQKGLSIRLNSLKDATADMLLRDLSKDTVLSIVKFYQKRPKNKNTGKPISITTAKTQINTLKRLLDHLIEEEIIEPIRGLQKLFKNIRIKKTKVDITKQLKGNPVFEIDDLVLLYHNANSKLRGYMLLGLNLGFTQKEISSMLVGMVDMDNEVITRFREKTDFTVKAKWKMWNETLVFVKHNIKPNYAYEYRIDDDGNTILYRNSIAETWQQHHEKGIQAYQRLIKDKLRAENMYAIPEEYIFNRVVYTNDNGVKIDNIASAWSRLRKKLGKNLKNPYSFKSLRKTGADMIQNIAGVDISQVYLSHTPTTLAQKNYTNPQFEKLGVALEVMREQLQPVFENVPIYPRLDIVNGQIKDWDRQL